MPSDLAGTRAGSLGVPGVHGRFGHLAEGGQFCHRKHRTSIIVCRCHAISTARHDLGYIERVLVFPFINKLDLATEPATTAEESAQRILGLLKQLDDIGPTEIPRGDGPVAVQLAGMSNITQTAAAMGLMLAYKHLTGEEVPEEYQPHNLSPTRSA